MPPTCINVMRMHPYIKHVSINSIIIIIIVIIIIIDINIICVACVHQNLMVSINFRFVSVEKGFNYLNEIGYFTPLMDQWRTVSSARGATKCSFFTDSHFPYFTRSYHQ